MNEQLTINSKPAVNWGRYLILVALIGGVVGVMMLVLTAVPRPQAIAALGGASICGFKFNDLNGNGVWERPGEPGIADWEIQLLGGGGLTITHTNIDGSYCFDGLADGQYTVMEILRPGWQQTFPDPATGAGHYDIVIDPNDPGYPEYNEINFGNQEGAADAGIHGAKFYD
ncbi:MAG TPA: SdrD B-like domain-containing protein, partial [Chloroflexota bacterium]|nr:SdrD B-like domain-containing protein [Chloroflexota bacterium]